MNKKVLIGIVLVIVIAIIGISAFAIIKIEEDRKLEMEEDAVALTLKDKLDTEFLSKVKVSDFILNLNGNLIDDYYIDTTSIGEKETQIQYTNYRNNVKTKSFKINIVDTKDPVIYMQSTMTVPVGYNKDILYTVLSGDECDSKPVRKIEGDYDLNKEGSYNLKYIITDASGNKAEKDFILKVVPKGQTSKATQREKVLFSVCLSKYKNENTSLGIDVSKWQGDIDWNAVKDAGVEFAFIRLAYQDGFGGEYLKDKYFEQNIKGALNAGVKVGVYFYSYARSVEDAYAQADWIHSQIKDYNVELPVVFDWESWNSFSKSEMSFYDINKVAQEFIKRVEEYGNIGALYSSKNYLEKIWYTDEFENIWLAHYTDKTNYTGKYKYWQMCDTGRVEGINGAVDIDIWYR